MAENPPITPAWAFRHIVWEDSLNTSEGAKEVVDSYIRRGIPVGSVIIDSPWSTSYNDFNWDRMRYPDAEDMIGYFKNKNVKVILWLTGAINNKCKDTPLQKGDTYDEAVMKNYGINDSKPHEWWKGEGIHIDFTNPEATEWWYSQLDKVFIDGVYGWKVDQGEYWFGDTLKTSKGFMSNAEFRPYYYDAMFDYTVNRNPAGLIIARPYSHQGGCAASKGKLNMGWCGDFSGDWEGLRHQIDNIYTSAANGYGSLACEVGGFYMKRSTKLQLIRYAQFGCMTSAMINGGENGAFTNHLPWYHGEDAEKIYRTCVVLHEELVPYLFSSSVNANLEGGSLIRETNQVQQSHCLGKCLFTKALTSGDSNAEFILPSGDEWIDCWTGEKFAGGTRIEAMYPPERFPLFVKSGSIIPIEPAQGSFWASNLVKADKKRTFLIYPSGNKQAVLHLPKGEGVDYDNYTVCYDSDSKHLSIKCPAHETVNVIIKGIGKVKGISGGSLIGNNPQTGDLALSATGQKIELDIRM